MQSKTGKSISAKSKASDIVFEEILQTISKGIWKPGDKIPSENKLAQQYGVSRVTVRAAIQRLISINLVESKQGGGTYVCDLTTDQRLEAMRPLFPLSRVDRRNVFEFRRTIEAGEVGLAAARVTPEIIEKMRVASERMEHGKTEEEITEYDLEFHRLIAEATGNPIFIKVFDMMCSTYRSLLEGNVSIMGAAGVKYHHMITDALEERDEELARALMRKHLDFAMVSTGEYEGEPPEDL